MMLYPNGIKWGKKKPSVEDLRAIAYFNRIVKNYLMMEKLLKEPSEKS